MRRWNGAQCAMFARCLPEFDVDIEFQVLGRPELRAAGQKSVTVPQQLWCVLVSLLMESKVPVTAETLVDRLWGDNPPTKASVTIRSYIWRIDRILSLATDDSVRVTRHDHSYLLEIEPHSVDVHRFRSLKRQSDSLAESGEIRQAAELLREAEAIWRGDQALAGLAGDWIGRVRDRLTEERRTVTARRIELELTLGRHAGLLAELCELCEQHPLDEAMAAHRMTALVRSERKADALRVYQETRARLVAEGLDPSAELARLQQRILQQDPELAITPAYRRAGQEPQPNTLPPDIGDLVGRTAEMRALTEEARPRNGPALLVIEGMGGIGKTALAVHACHSLTQRYPDAQLYLNMRAHDEHGDPLEPSDALGDLLAMLDGPSTRIPGTLAERAGLWHAELACRRVVLILDDVTGPEQVRHLLPGAGDIMIIVTSRLQHPDWGAARKLVLQVLPQAAATELFTRVAGDVAGHQGDQIVRVSRWCGCLPLAIRLVASSLRSGAVASLQALLDELDEPIRDHGPGSELSRRIQATFELSYRRLTAGEQRYFRYLGISPCLDMTAHSGAVLAGVTLAESRATLGALASQHLLEQTSAGRFDLHDLIRAFAAARFADEDPAPDVRHSIGRLADYYLCAANHASGVRHADRWEAHPADDGQSRVAPFVDMPSPAAAWLESEWGNILRLAEHCARHEYKRQCAELIHAVGEFLKTSGRWEDALAAHLKALQACRDLDDLAGIARSALDLSLICMLTGRSEAALSHADEAATAFGTVGDQRGRAAALNRVGIIHRRTARFRVALAYHEEALDIYRAVDDLRGSADTLVPTGITLMYLGRLEEEMSLLSRALDIYRAQDNLRGQAITLNNIGTVQHYRGYYKDAMRSYQASRDIFREIGGRQNLAIADHNLARLQQYKGNYGAAIDIYRKVLITYGSLGDMEHQAYAHADIGSVYCSTDRFDEALVHYENAASAAEKTGDRYAYSEALCGIAESYFGSGRLDTALENYERAARLAGEIESLYLKAKALSGIAEIMLHTRGLETARIYWREAHNIFAQIGVSEAATIELRLHTLGAPAS
jgi:DNA-binding SARP family transcriptional activator/tetratricopeptide (TPR) repeat protein